MEADLLMKRAFEVECEKSAVHCAWAAYIKAKLGQMAEADAFYTQAIQLLGDIQNPHIFLPAAEIKMGLKSYGDANQLCERYMDCLSTAADANFLPIDNICQQILAAHQKVPTPFLITAARAKFLLKQYGDDR